MDAAMELWGGVECTVNRVGDRYFDQLARSGHAFRLGDLERFAGLGVKALRYPVLWERTLDAEGRLRWEWAEERLPRLLQLGVRPIVGLVHHGSGPPHTSLLDPGFAEGLAGFAAAFAARFPWVRDYTPVNEPLTTARFSALYGHWYPHGRDDGAFARALIHQLRAVVLSMEAVRRVNPAARLVQTEDLGTVFATAPLRYQADFENQRRYLTFDLLCGRVRRDHPLWGYLRGAGIGEDELRFFVERPCPPDVLGVNYYLTSDRFLDHRTARYPVAQHGGNGRVAYADAEAVRAREAGILGHEALLSEVWRRYQRTVALTEVHLGCTWDEQLRWLAAAWRGAERARRAGADVAAVTVWALLGSFDWNSLVTREEGYYEPGAFDVRGAEPRVTVLGALGRALGRGVMPRHRVLEAPGWWERPERLLHRPAPVLEAQPG